MSKYQYVAKRGGVYRWETPHFDNKKKADWYLKSIQELNPIWAADDLTIELVVKPKREE